MRKVRCVRVIKPYSLSYLAPILCIKSRTIVEQFFSILHYTVEVVKRAVTFGSMVPTRKSFSPVGDVWTLIESFGHGPSSAILAQS